MKVKVLVMALVSAAACLYLIGPAPAQPAPARPDQLVLEACSRCHTVERICNGFGKKDEKAWTATVGRMVGKGAKVTKEEQPAVVKYLAEQKAGSKPVCK
jgi:mono/diheme cytochrome c family protein